MRFFFHDTSTEFTLANINDDLVGFFNSVPQGRLLDAINSLILAWQERHGQVTLSVDMSQRGNPLQLSYVGKFHKAPRKTRAIELPTYCPLFGHLFRATFSKL